MAVTEKQKAEVKRLLIEGRKIEAIKYLRNEFNLDLRSAKELADHIEEEMHPSEFVLAKPSPFEHGKKAGKLFGNIFGGIGLVFLIIVAINIYLDLKHEKTSIKITGVVIANPSQPTIEYEFDGEKFYYYSSTSSNPPSYYIGEEVELFVDPSNPENTLVNTITDRWLLSIILGSIGTVFFIVGLAVNRIF